MVALTEDQQDNLAFLFQELSEVTAKMAEAVRKYDIGELLLLDEQSAAINCQINELCQTALIANGKNLVNATRQMQ